MKTLQGIEKKSHITLLGDHTIHGNIGSGTVLILKGNRLVINGDVDNDTQIILQAEQSSEQSEPQWRGIQINGLVGDDVHIKSSYHVTVAGSYGARGVIKTTSGNIQLTSVGSHCFVQSESGNISLDTLDKYGQLKSSHGNQIVQRVNNSACMETISGNITVLESVAPDASITTSSGNVNVGTLSDNASISCQLGHVSCDFADSRASIKSMSGDIKVTKAQDGTSINSMSGNIEVNGHKKDPDFPAHQEEAVIFSSHSSRCHTRHRSIVIVDSQKMMEKIHERYKPK